jgi:hypothetical protein
MSADGRATQAALAWPVRTAAAQLAQEHGKQSIEVPEAAARLARAIYGEA